MDTITSTREENSNSKMQRSEKQALHFFVNVTIGGYYFDNNHLIGRVTEISRGIVAKY
jgi:hypothetical protein